MGNRSVRISSNGVPIAFDKNQKRVCIDIIRRGECNRGDACPFSHDWDEAPSLSASELAQLRWIGKLDSKGVQVCWDFHNRGKHKCPRGDNCQYSHEPLVPSTPRSSPSHRDESRYDDHWHRRSGDDHREESTSKSSSSSRRHRSRSRSATRDHYHSSSSSSSRGRSSSDKSDSGSTTRGKNSDDRHKSSSRSRGSSPVRRIGDHRVKSESEPTIRPAAAATMVNAVSKSNTIADKNNSSSHILPDLTCWEWRDFGRCRFAEKCRFAESHGETTAGRSVATLTHASERRHWSEDKLDAHGKQLCYDFHIKGHCSRSVSCWWSHLPSAAQIKAGQMRSSSAKEQEEKHVEGEPKKKKKSEEEETNQSNTVGSVIATKDATDTVAVPSNTTVAVASSLVCEIIDDKGNRNAVLVLDDRTTDVTTDASSASSASLSGSNADSSSSSSSSLSVSTPSSFSSVANVGTNTSASVVITTSATTSEATAGVVGSTIDDAAVANNATSVAAAARDHASQLPAQTANDASTTAVAITFLSSITDTIVTDSQILAGLSKESTGAAVTEESPASLSSPLSPIVVGGLAWSATAQSPKIGVDLTPNNDDDNNGAKQQPSEICLPARNGSDSSLATPSLAPLIESVEVAAAVVTPATTAVVVATAPPPTKASGSAPTNPNHIVRIIGDCWEFRAYGACKRGATCGYRHATSATPDPNAREALVWSKGKFDSKGREMCFDFFNRRNGCLRDQRCPFSHDGEFSKTANVKKLLSSTDDDVHNPANKRARVR